MTLLRATILPNPDPATVTGPVQRGWVSEQDANGNTTAIVITGNIEDTNWSRIEQYRIEGDELAGLPASTAAPGQSDDPSSPRYQAVMKLVAVFVTKRWTEIDAVWQDQHRPAIVPRATAEVAALPALTPEMIAALVPPSTSPTT